MSPREELDRMLTDLSTMILQVQTICHIENPKVRQGSINILERVMMDHVKDMDSWADAHEFRVRRAK